MEKKPDALDQAAPLRGWKLDPTFDTLRRLLEARFGPRGKREYIQVLRLHEKFPVKFSVINWGARCEKVEAHAWCPTLI